VVHKPGDALHSSSEEECCGPTTRVWTQCSGGCVSPPLTERECTCGPISVTFCQGASVQPAGRYDGAGVVFRTLAAYSTAIERETKRKYSCDNLNTNLFARLQLRAFTRTSHTLHTKVRCKMDRRPFRVRQKSRKLATSVVCNDVCLLGNAVELQVRKQLRAYCYFFFASIL